MMPEEQGTIQTPTGLSDGDVSELAGQLDAKNAEIDDLKAQLEQVARAKDNEHDRIAELQAKQDRAEAQIAELQQQRDLSDVREFCSNFELTPLVDNTGFKFYPSPVFMDVVKKHVTASPSAGVIEFQEGNKTVRETMKALFQEIAEMAAKQSLLVPMAGEYQGHSAPNQKKTIESMITELQTADSTLSYGDAWVKASVQLGEGK